jgi:DNA-binding NtrC family response regulator
MSTILLVDDDCLVLRFCTCLLESLEGVNLLKASNALEALEYAGVHGRTIDLLLAEICIRGGVTGVELASTLAASRPRLKVLLMSGSYAEDDCLLPEWRFIAKPFPPGQLLATVEQMLGIASTELASDRAGKLRA